MGGEAAEAGFDATIGDVFLNLGEEVLGNFRWWSMIGFEGRGRHVFRTDQKPLPQKKRSKTEAQENFAASFLSPPLAIWSKRAHVRIGRVALTAP